MAFKMKSGMKPSFKSMGSSPVKQYADKNVSVDKVSDDGMTFTGTDSKGKTGQYKTSGYDAEIMQSDSVGVSGDAVSSMQMEYDMVKGTKYEKDFIDYHGKGNQPGTGKSPAKSRASKKAAKAAVKGAQAADRGKSRKANRQAVKAAGAAADAVSDGSPVLKRGLWDNIHAKRRRGEKMRKKGDKGAPTEKAIRDSQ